MSEYEGGISVFDFVLDSNHKAIDRFFTRGRHQDLEFFYLSQSYFVLTKRTMKSTATKVLLTHF